MVKQEIEHLDQIHSDPSCKTQELVQRANGGDDAAFAELISHVSTRLCGIAHRMLAKYPHVRRWEETDDILQESLLRLHRGLKRSKTNSAKEFFGLAATILRHTMIDLSRHYYGVYGLGTKHQSGSFSERTPADAASSHNLQDLDDWSAFHAAIEQLPDEEREVFSLVWYTGLNHSQASGVLGVSTRTIIRRMNRARLQLGELLQDNSAMNLGESHE